MCCRGVIKKGLGQVVPGDEGGTQENRGQAEAAASQKQIQMSKRSRGVKLERAEHFRKGRSLCGKLTLNKPNL